MPPGTGGTIHVPSGPTGVEPPESLVVVVVVVVVSVDVVEVAVDVVSVEVLAMLSTPKAAEPAGVEGTAGAPGTDWPSVAALMSAPDEATAADTA